MLNKVAILKAAKDEYYLHPRANLIDYYKLFFQAAYGPGHFVPNEEQAWDFLKRELASAESFEQHHFQKIDLYRNFYRVNLKVIKAKLVSPEDFFTGFIKSVESNFEIDISRWKQEWQFIEIVLKKSPLKIQDFEEASSRLNDCLSHGNINLSHSPVYRKEYHPHYRLFSHTEFIKMKLV